MKEHLIICHSSVCVPWNMLENAKLNQKKTKQNLPSNPLHRPVLPGYNIWVIYWVSNYTVPIRIAPEHRKHQYVAGYVPGDSDTSSVQRSDTAAGKYSSHWNEREHCTSTSFVFFSLHSFQMSQAHCEKLVIIKSGHLVKCLCPVTWGMGQTITLFWVHCKKELM